MSTHSGPHSWRVGATSRSGSNQFRCPLDVMVIVDGRFRRINFSEISANGPLSNLTATWHITHLLFSKRRALLSLDSTRRRNAYRSPNRFWYDGGRSISEDGGLPFEEILANCPLFSFTAT